MPAERGSAQWSPGLRRRAARVPIGHRWTLDRRAHVGVRGLLDALEHLRLIHDLSAVAPGARRAARDGGGDGNRYDSDQIFHLGVLSAIRLRSMAATIAGRPHSAFTG